MTTPLGPAPAEIALRLRAAGAVEYDGHPGWWRVSGHYYPWPEAIDAALAKPPAPASPSFVSRLLALASSPAVHLYAPLALGALAEAAQQVAPAVVTILPAPWNAVAGATVALFLRATPLVIRALKGVPTTP